MAAKRDLLVLSGLWLFATALNIAKPYHVDDGAHLLIAQWIAAHPLHPMQGMLNWTGTKQPLWRTNQPHLYFYALAAWGAAFGWGELTMHTLQALFSGAAIGLCYGLARRLAPDQALFCTAALALNPAFVVSQNLMVDVPLLAVWLGFFWALAERRMAWAGVACAAALLIKYSSLVLLPILLLLASKRRVLLIPLAALLAWSAFTLWDYGGVHLLTAFHAGQATYTPRAGKSFELERRLVKAVIAWIVAVGAFAPFGLRFRSRWPYAALAGGFLVLAFGVAAGVVADTLADHALWLGFAVTGILLLPLLRWPGTREDALLWLWVVLCSVFYILFAPAIGARHVLLILPALALLAARRGGFTRTGQAFVLGMSAVLTLGLAVSDFRAAAFYRAEAAALAAPHTMVAGHWGWQYYAQAHGMPELDTAHPPPPGTILLVPRDVDHTLPPGLALVPVGTVSFNASAYDPLCTGRPARFYLSYTFRGPWSLTSACTVEIGVFRAG